MENPFKNSIQSVHCACSRVDGLFVPVRQLSLLLALLLFLFTLSFLGGYFLGKKHVVDDFVTKVEQDSFADQIYSSLCLLSDQDPEELRAASEEEMLAQVAELPSQEASLIALPSEVAIQEPIAQADSQPALDEKVSVSSPASQEKNPSLKKFYAQLIGFGSEPAAQTFVKRMKKKSIPLEIKQRESFTAHGKRRVWYQVVTRTFEDKELLAKLVDRISKEEKIVGVQIVTA